MQETESERGGQWKLGVGGEIKLDLGPQRSETKLESFSHPPPQKKQQHPPI